MKFPKVVPYYFGFDLSTQQLKCLAINDKLKIVHSETIEFDTELPHYHTEKGVYINGGRVESPVAMWLEALDLVLTKYQNAGFPFEQVHGISGSCQQHGSVFWTPEADNLLYNGVAIGTGNSLLEQVGPNALSRPTAPNWQDHSTSNQCQEMENIVGGPVRMANLTGSKGHLRFTGPQILKIAEEEPQAYNSTGSITLVSNFLSSILCGELFPLEEADACGMNLYDIRNRRLDPSLLELIDGVNPKALQTKRLLDKLKGEPIKSENSARPLGVIGNYFVEKYKFPINCNIFPFTGDNLATICSLPLEKNDILVSLGTSTTVLLVTDQYHPSPNYHLFTHPTIPGEYMGMICYCNGSLAREGVRNELNQDGSNDWTLFNEAVMDPSVNTSNELGIYFPLGEIVPSVNATIKRVIFDETSGEIQQEIEQFTDKRHDAKCIVESQALSCRVRIAPLLSSTRSSINHPSMGQSVSFDYDKNTPLETYLEKRPQRVFFVGGASKNDAIVNKFAEVLGATKGNYRLDTPNSCALGGCFKALWSDLIGKNVIDSSFDRFLQQHFDWNELEHICDSDTDQWASYTNKIVALSQLESAL